MTLVEEVDTSYMDLTLGILSEVKQWLETEEQDANQ